MIKNTEPSMQDLYKKLKNIQTVVNKNINKERVKPTVDTELDLHQRRAYLNCVRACMTTLRKPK